MSPLERKRQMQRGKPLKAKPRSKGSRGELAVIEILKAHGYHGARRNWMSGGMGGSDIIGGPEGFGLEVKVQERLNIWAALDQAREAAAPTETPTVVFRRNRSGWYACIPLEDMLGLIAEAQS